MPAALAVPNHGGYDSTLEENYLALAAGALRRGYNVVTFDARRSGDLDGHEGAVSVFHQRTFDWLDTVLAS